MIDKEQRVKQLAIMFAKAIKGIEDGIFDNAVLIPFSAEDDVKVLITRDSLTSTTVVNAAE